MTSFEINDVDLEGIKDKVVIITGQTLHTSFFASL
jgi:hypothetical protein